MSTAFDTYSQMAKKTKHNPSAGTGPKLDDLLSFIVLKPKKWKRIRILPPVLSSAVIWFDYKTQSGKDTQIPKYVTGWNVLEDCYGEAACPWVDRLSKMTHHGEAARIARHYYANVIDRSLEKKAKKSKPTKSEAKTGFKDPDNKKSVTPVKVMRFPPGLFKRILQLEGTNNGHDVFDVKNGLDLNVCFDPDAAPALMFDIQTAGESSALEDHEKEYLLYDIHAALQELHGQDVKQQETEARNIFGKKKDKDDTAEMIADPPKKKKAGKKAKGKGKGKDSGDKFDFKESKKSKKGKKS